MSELSYPIPFRDTQFEEEIKKSRFITVLSHTQGLEQSKAFVQQIRDLHPQARHHCWACVSESPSYASAWGFSDDGEPSGTAGKPILAQLTGSGVGEITAVVVRYSGGIKLGTGGLVKAYGGGVKNALALLQTQLKTLTQTYSLDVAYADESLVRHCLEQRDIQVEKQDFQQCITLWISVPLGSESALQQQLTNLTRGKSTLHPFKP